MTSTTRDIPGAAESGLVTVTRLLATTTRAGGIGDPLLTPADAQRWDGELSARDLAPLRRFREALRDAFRADRTGPPEAEPVEAAVTLAWTPAGVRFEPRGKGWHRIAARVSMELLLADAAGVLPRLKTCAYEPCGFPFVDLSRNRSRTWHDTATCGNIVNLRASRARRAKA